MLAPSTAKGGVDAFDRVPGALRGRGARRRRDGAQADKMHPALGAKRGGMAEHGIVNLQSSTAKVIRLDTKGHPGDLRGKHFAGMAHM